MADDLMLEVTGSSQKAQSALDKVIEKVTQLQKKFEAATPSLTAFSEKMSSLAASSKAVANFNSFANTVQKSTLSVKNAESRMAMYQARLDRASVSSERSRQQLEKLAAVHQKVAQAAQIDAKNQEAFGLSADEFARRFNHTGTGYSSAAPEEPAMPSAPAGHSRLASEILGPQPKATFNVDTSAAESSVSKMQVYLNSLAPSISRMSAEAQAQFDVLSGKLMNLSLQIDNQRALYDKLAISASEAASAHGKNSIQYLRLEKQMLSADNAIQRMIDKQDALKAKLADTASVASIAGDQMEKASHKSTSGWQKTLDMFGRMLIRIAAFKIYSAIAQGITTGIQNMAQASSQANATMSSLSTSALYLQNSVAAALMPALQALTPVITQVADALADVFNMIAMLTARIFNHATTVTIAKRANVDYAATIAGTGNKAKQSTAAIKELQKTVMGFDEINALSKPAGTDSGSGSINPASNGMPSPNSMFQTVKIPDSINKIGSITDQIGKVISGWWNGLTSAQKWGAGIGGTAGLIIGGIIGRLIGGPIGQVVGAALGAAAGVAIGIWWESLTPKEKWGAGIGATAGTVIGAIIGGLIGGKIGAIVGAVLGGVVGALVGKWWADLTTKEKWSAGIGAGAGATIGGIIGGILTGGNPIGIAVGAALGITIGAIVGKWWADLTTKQKWSVGIGAGAGAVIGGIIGGMIGGPIGTVVGAALGITIGAVIGKWWSGLTTKQKWSNGIGAGAGAVIGGIIGGLIAGPIGVVVGAALGGTAGTIIAQWWNTLKTKQKWTVGTTGIGAIIGAIIGGIFLGPLGVVLGAGIGGLAARACLKNQRIWLK